MAAKYLWIYTDGSIWVTSKSFPRPDQATPNGIGTGAPALTASTLLEVFKIGDTSHDYGTEVCKLTGSGNASASALAVTLPASAISDHPITAAPGTAPTTVTAIASTGSLAQGSNGTPAGSATITGTGLVAGMLSGTLTISGVTYPITAAGSGTATLQGFVPVLSAATGTFNPQPGASSGGANTPAGLAAGSIAGGAGTFGSNAETLGEVQ
jgi:hypothetical protein